MTTITKRSAAGCDYIPVRSMTQPREIQGYLAIWGSPDQKDCFGTYFDRDNPPMMDLAFVPKPLRYEHGQDETVGKDPIGEVDKVWLDDTGIPFHAMLNDQHPAYSRISGEVRDGLLATSSGTMDYLAEFADDGRFVSWPVGELSLTASPCEERMPHVAAIRSKNGLKQLEIRPQDASVQAGSIEAPGEPGEPSHEDAGAVTQTRSDSTKEPPMADKPVVDPTKEVPPAKKRAGGLTLAMLGLDANASVQDVATALVDLLGSEQAADDYLDRMIGVDDNGLVEPDEPEEDQLGEMEFDRAFPASDALDEDTRPEDFTGDTDDEDLTEGKPGIPQRHNQMARKIVKALGGQAKAAKPRSKPGQGTAATQMRRLQEQNKQLRALLTAAPVRDTPTGRFDRRALNPRVEMRDLIYDGDSASDLCFAVKLLQARGRTPSESLVRAATVKVADEIEKKTLVGSDVTVRWITPFRSVSDVMSTDPKHYMKMIRSAEVMGDSNTNYGSNYLGVFYDTGIWLKARAMPIWRRLEEKGMTEKVIPLGYASDTIPLEGADFTWYRVPETIDVDATGRPKINITPGRAGTSAQSLTVRTLGALVYYSVLLEEDSIVPMAAELNRKATVESQEQIEFVIFCGDTATGTGNLNYKNGTVAAGDVYNYTAADGMLKAAIIGNSGANARAAGSLSDLDYQLLFRKLGNNGIVGSDPEKLMYVVDPLTGFATDRLPIMKTGDINSAATIEKGHAKEMWAVPIYRSGQIALADSTGYIDSVTPANNAYGRILLVRPDQWVIGFKRNVTFEFFRDAPGQANGMVITLRLGLQYRDATQCAAATYSVVVS